MTAIDILRNEHELIFEMLDLLEHHLAGVRAGAPLNGEFARWVLDFLSEFADDTHHAKEEGVLFGMLEGRGLVRGEGALAMMLADHARCRALAAEMTVSLARNDAGAFVAQAGALAESLRRHVTRENESLFALAERVMGPADDAAAVQAFGRVVREREGVRVRERHLAATARWRDLLGVPA